MSEHHVPLLGVPDVNYESRSRFQSMFRKQIPPSNSDSNKSGGLKRNLSIWDLITYGLSSTLGTGILVTVGQVANQTTGPAVVFSFMFAGFAAFLSALCYSEFAARIPVSGSAYSFAYISLGEVIAWFVGWNLTLEYAISASAVASGWTGYVVAALNSIGVNVPSWLSNIHIYGFLQLSPLSALIVLLCTVVLLFGMKESARFNIAMTIINMIVILFFIITGAFYVDTSNWSPFFPYGFAGTWAGVGKVFFSYIGFDSVSTLAGEVANPKRDLPIGIVGTLFIVTGLYVVTSLVLTGMQRYSCIDVNAPLAIAFNSSCNNLHLHWASTLIAFGSVTTITATCLCSLIGQPRIFYQMSQDGLLFPIFGVVNDRGVPMYGTIITGILSAVIALFLDLSILLDMISIGTLLAFTVVCGGVVIIRYTPTKPTGRRNRIPIIILSYVITCFIFGAKQKIPMHVSLVVEVFIWIIFALPMIFMFTWLYVEVSKVKPDNSDLKDTFNAPLVPFVPCLGILMNVWFIMSLSIQSLYRLIIWTVIGMSIYFFYGFRHSALNRSIN